MNPWLHDFEMCTLQRKISQLMRPFVVFGGWIFLCLHERKASQIWYQNVPVVSGKRVAMCAVWSCMQVHIKWMVNIRQNSVLGQTVWADRKLVHGLQEPILFGSETFWSLADCEYKDSKGSHVRSQRNAWNIVFRETKKREKSYETKRPTPCT
jgi:hypothetical protein